MRTRKTLTGLLAAAAMIAVAGCGRQRPRVAACRIGFVDDGKALEGTLRDDITFIDGEKFDAAAMKTSLDRAMTLESSRHKGALARVECVEYVHDYGVQINLNDPRGNLPIYSRRTWAR